MRGGGRHLDSGMAYREGSNLFPFTKVSFSPLIVTAISQLQA